MSSASLCAIEGIGSLPLKSLDTQTSTKQVRLKPLHELLEKDLVEHDQGDYYVDSDRAEDIKFRLEWVDAAKRLHETAPDDDMYAVTDWVEELNSS